MDRETEANMRNHLHIILTTARLMTLEEEPGSPAAENARRVLTHTQALVALLPTDKTYNLVKNA